MSFASQWGPPALTAGIALVGAFGSQAYSHARLRRPAEEKERNDALDRVVDSGFELAGELGLSAALWSHIRANIKAHGRAVTFEQISARLPAIAASVHGFEAKCHSYLRRFPEGQTTDDVVAALEVARSLAGSLPDEVPNEKAAIGMGDNISGVRRDLVEKLDELKVGEPTRRLARPRARK